MTFPDDYAEAVRMGATSQTWWAMEPDPQWQSEPPTEPGIYWVYGYLAGDWQAWVASVWEDGQLETEGWWDVRGYDHRRIESLPLPPPPEGS